MWPECASPVNTKATKKTRTESRTAGKGQKKSGPEYRTKAKVSEPQTAGRSSHNQRTTPGARCQAKFTGWESRLPLGGRKGGNLSFFQVAAALAAKLAATHSAARRKGRRKSRPRSAAKRLGLDFPADFVAGPPGSTEPAARGWAARALIDCAQRAPSMSA